MHLMEIWFVLSISRARMLISLKTKNLKTERNSSIRGLEQTLPVTLHSSAPASPSYFKHLPFCLRPSLATGYAQLIENRAELLGN